MGFLEPRRPSVCLPRPWRNMRRAGIVLCLPLAGLAVFLSLFLWRLASGPVDVTFLSRYAQPLSLVPGTEKGRPAGRVLWSRLQIAWQPQKHGVPSGLTIILNGTRFLRDDGRLVGQIADMEMVLSLSSLFRGAIVPRRFHIDRAALSLRRSPRGAITLDLPHQRKSGGTLPIRFDRLTSIDAQNVSLTLNEPESEPVLHLRSAGMRLSRSRDKAWSGEGRGVLSFGESETAFSFTAERAGKRRSRWRMTAGSVTPSRLGAFWPVLTPWDMPVSLKGEGALITRRDGSVSVPSAEIGLTAGSGRIRQRNAAPLVVQEGSLSARVTLAEPLLAGPMQLDVPQARLVLRDSGGHLADLQARGRFHADRLRPFRQLDGEAETNWAQFSFATLASIWPENLMRGARRWMTDNITDGQGENLRVAVHVHSNAGREALKVTSLSGTLDGRDLTIHWLRPVAPVTGVQAHAHFAGPDRLDIDVAKGRQAAGRYGAIALPSGRVTIAGLMKKNQTTDISVTLQGGVPSLLSVLAHPRLRLLSRHPLPVTHPAGQVQAHLHLSFPLIHRLDVRDIRFDAQLYYAQLAMEVAALGAVRQGQGAISVTQDGLTLQGRALIRNVPGDIALYENFAGGGARHVIRSLTLQTKLDRNALTQLTGLSFPAGMLSGPIPAEAHYLERGTKDTREEGIDFSADLTPVGVTSPFWTKEAGTAARLDGHAVLSAGRVTRLDRLQARGPKLALSGRAEFGGAERNELFIDRFRLGRSEGTARLAWPKAAETAPVRISLSAGTLDLSPLFQASSARHAPSPKGASLLPAGNWALTLQAKTLFYGPEKYLGQVSTRLAWRDRSLREGRLTMRTPRPVQMTLMDKGMDKGACRPFSLEIRDFGGFLRELGLYDRLEGGVLRLKGAFAPDEEARHAGLGLGLPPFDGRADMSDFALAKPPAALVAATLFAPLHWGQLGRDRFEAMHLHMPLRLTQAILSFHDAAIGNSVLGGTIGGTVDLRTDALKLNGTIVPMFGLNAAAGKLPGIGPMLAPDKGGGILSLTYSVRGSIYDPRFDYNPFSVFVPSALRHILP